jgi:TRAP-type mannitol/chloroaromatic compound transport system permease small subunit
VAPFLSVSRTIDYLNERLGRVTAWAIVVAIVELQWYLFGAVFMLCAAWTLKDNEHIRIDILSNRLRKRTRDWIDVFGHVLFLLPFLLVMIYVSTPFFTRSFESGEVSTNAGGLLIWPAKGLILLGFIVLLLQWASELIKRIAIIRGDLQDTYAAGGHQAAAEAEAERLLAELAEAERASAAAKTE